MTSSETWHPDSYLHQFLELAPSLRFQAATREEWAAWHAALRRQLFHDLALIPLQPAPLDTALIEEKVQCDGYTRERVSLTVLPGLRMPVYVLVPDGASGPLPAMVACHGHCHGSREIVGLPPAGHTGIPEPTYQKNFAIELARAGFVTVVPELLGFGDMRTEAEAAKNDYSSCHSVSTFLLHFGQTMSGHRAYQALRCVDFLESRPEVDATRIGSMGISGGGLTCAFATALDDRIKAAVVSGFLNTFRASILSVFHCVDNYVPGIGLHAELPDIVSLIAPRPLLIEAGTKDPIFPIAGAREAAQRVCEVYRLLGEEDKFEQDIFEGTHEISGVKAYPWLRKWLS